MLINTHVDVYMGFSDCKEVHIPRGRSHVMLLTMNTFRWGERWREMAQEITNFFPNIVALEREPVLLWGSLLLQQKGYSEQQEREKI